MSRLNPPDSFSEKDLTDLAELEIDESKKTVPEPDKEHSEYFEVLGAGKIEVSRSSKCLGSEKGFSFGVSWGSYGYAGGILSKPEAKRLAEHILKNL